MALAKLDDNGPAVVVPPTKGNASPPSNGGSSPKNQPSKSNTAKKPQGGKNKNPKQPEAKKPTATQPVTAPKGETLEQAITRMRNQDVPEWQIKAQIRKWHPTWTDAQIAKTMKAAPGPGGYIAKAKANATKGKPSESSGRVRELRRDIRETIEVISHMSSSLEPHNAKLERELATLRARTTSSTPSVLRRELRVVGQVERRLAALRAARSQHASDARRRALGRDVQAAKPVERKVDHAGGGPPRATGKVVLSDRRAKNAPAGPTASVQRSGKSEVQKTFKTAWGGMYEIKQQAFAEVSYPGGHGHVNVSFSKDGNGVEVGDGRFSLKDPAIAWLGKAEAAGAPQAIGPNDKYIQHVQWAPSLEVGKKKLKIPGSETAVEVSFAATVEDGHPSLEATVKVTKELHLKGGGTLEVAYGMTATVTRLGTDRKRPGPPEPVLDPRLARSPDELLYLLMIAALARLAASGRRPGEVGTP